MSLVLRSFKDGFKKARRNTKNKNGKRYTQESFAEAFGVSVDTVKNWEQGRTTPSIDTLIELCDFFECDMDYLFGSLDCKTHDVQFIHKETGLSEKAIKKLKYYNQRMQECTEAINILLLSANFENALYQIRKYMDAIKLTDGLMKIRHNRSEEVFSKEPDCANGAYNWPYNDTLDQLWSESVQKEELLEYHLDTHFKFLIAELSRLAGRKI